MGIAEDAVGGVEDPALAAPMPGNDRRSIPSRRRGRRVQAATVLLLLLVQVDHLELVLLAAGPAKAGTSFTASSFSASSSRTYGFA